MTLGGRQHSIVAIVVLLVGLAVNLGFAAGNRAAWGIDFNQFYSAAKLAGTGHLYDWGKLQRLEAENGGPAIPTGRLPVVIFGHKLFLLFPFPLARVLWLALGSFAFAGFALLWPGLPRAGTAVALAWSLPAMMVLLFGQDTCFWLCFFACGLWLLERGRPVAAGLAFSLCICKFHFGLGLFILLLARRRWKTLAGGAAGVVALVSASFLIEGPGWVSQYRQMSQILAATPDVRPTLSGLVDRLGLPMPVEFAGSAAVLVLLFLFCRKVDDLGLAGAAAAACGLLVGHHGLFADTVLLLPLAVYTPQLEVPAWLRAWSVVLLSPAAFLISIAVQNSLVWQVTIPAYTFATLLLLFPKRVPQ